MAGLHEFRERLLSDGKITVTEVALIEQYIHEDGQLDYQDIKFLVSLIKDADYVCPEFDEMFFPVMRQVILADGQVTADEQYLLLHMLYSDGDVRECERQFISEIVRDVDTVTPELEYLCETAMSTLGKSWDVGGKPRETAS